MGATDSKEPQLKVNEFVRQKLIECHCESVINVFARHEIDEAAFRLLSEGDLHILLPDKLGPRKKIYALIQRLRIEADIERRRYAEAKEESRKRLLNNRNIKNEPKDISGSRSNASPSTSLSPLVRPTLQKQVPQDPQQSSSANEISVFISSEKEVINVDDARAQDNKMTESLRYCLQNNSDDMLQSTATKFEGIDIKSPTVDALGKVSSNVSSNVLQSTADGNIQKCPYVKTYKYDNCRTDAPSVNSSAARSDLGLRTSQSTSKQTENDNHTAPPSNLLEPVNRHHSSMPGTSKSTCNVMSKVTEDREKGYEAKDKRDVKQGHKSQQKGVAESMPQNQAKQIDGKGQNYNNHGSSSQKLAIPHKIIESRKKLPIYKYKDEFLNMVKQNSVLIVIAETGSGKSTQMPQYLAKDNYGKKIVCTQPRRLAAKSLARRVAIEYGTKLGSGVGYRVRFDNCTENTTKISYVTEGVLIHELVSDVTANDYSVIIIDEAHERNLNTDVLLGCLKKSIQSRADLKLIISSATVEATKFATFFNNAPILDIPGRSHPVDIFYTGQPSSDYLNAVIEQVCRIHSAFSLGDVLVFLPGQEEIEQVADAIRMRIRDSPNSFVKEMVLPLYSKLPAEQQNLIFDPAPANTRKIILATNIAETSLTIDGIVYVVDSGLVKQAEYTPNANRNALECTTLVTIPITKAQAAQRSGRAGRTQPGRAYRIYSEATYEAMAKSPVPEILRGNLEKVALLLLSMGLKNVRDFDFLDSPPMNALVTALEKLEEFGALKSELLGNGLGHTLTSLGRQMSGFPIEPRLSKMLIVSAELGCSEEMLTIIAMLSAQVEKLFKRPKAEKLKADLKKKTFHCEEGDHITLLHVYNEWRRNNSSRIWCNEYFLDWRTLEEVYEIRCQLSNMFDEQKFVRKSCGDDFTKIKISIASGSFRNIAWRVNKYTYYTFSNPTDEHVLIHPSSVLFTTRPMLVIYDSVIKTKKAYMNLVLEIETEYIKQYAGHFYKKLLRVMPL